MDEEIKKARITIQSYIGQITTPSASQNKLEFRKQQYESAKEKFDSLMKDNAELAKEIIIKQVGNFHFYRLIKDRNLPQSWIDERRNLQKEIVKNPDKYSLQQIQNAVCDLYFRDSVKNTSINIRTLEDREGTQGNEIYNEKLAKYKDLFDATLKFIALTDATPEEVQRNLDQIIQLAQPLMQQGPIFQAVRDLLDLEERDFIVNRFGAKYTTNAFDDNLVGYHKELPKALIIDANSPSDIVSGAVNVKRDGESINVGSVKSNRTNMEFEITPEDVSKEGIYFVTATATDNVGNISNSEDQIGDIRFVIDKTKPTISHNIEDEVYKASSKEFDIAFKDNILLKNATIKVNGKVVEEFKDIDSTSLDYTLTLNKGIKQKVEIETEDMAGNIKTTTNKVTVSDSMFDYLLYNHTLYWIIGGIATLGIAGLIFALKRRKDKK